MKTLFLLACIATSSLFATSQEDLPPPYNTAEILPFADHGFYTNATQIEALILGRGVKTIIEVGSWLGTSTRHMASCLPEGGIVYAVDHWQGSSEHQPGQRAWIPEVERLYEYFLSNVIQAGLAHKIIPMRMSSLEAAKQLQVKADLIYIDAGHETKSVYKDLVAWYPHIHKNGVLCGDDWAWEPVQKAVKKFAKKNNLRIKASGNFWRLKKHRNS
jgi:predicted O-methyltransferase YrrM